MFIKVMWSVLFIGSLVLADTHYVDPHSPSPTHPYTNWPTAAHTIQEAVDAATTNDIVLVADGLYNSGFRVAPDQILCGNRVVIDKPITVQSVNGARTTIIEGQGPRGDNAIRGVWLIDGAVLSGFTVTNGHTAAINVSPYEDENGGGIFCTSTNALIENSVIISNSAKHGGGVLKGNLNDCTISGNNAVFFGGGTEHSTLSNCVISGNNSGDGGGSSFGILNNCIVRNNSASTGGGGVYDGILTDCIIYSNSARKGGGTVKSTLNDCTISGNSATVDGGGSYDGTLSNCTVSNNSAGSQGGGSCSATLNHCEVIGNSAQIFGGGVFGGILNNSLVSGNFSGDDGGGAYSGSLNNCTLADNYSPNSGVDRGTLKNCIIYNNGTNNIDPSSSLSFCYTNDPHFMDSANGNYRLSATSPCRDAGLNAFAPSDPSDLDDNPRIVNGTVDIGAYEHQGLLHFITASAGDHGNVTPSGKVNALEGTNLTFTFSPDLYYDTADVLTNNVSLVFAGTSDYTWLNVQADGTLHVTFTAELAVHDVPHWWLAKYGWSNSFDIAALADSDNDDLAAWEEFFADTNPTNSNTDGDQFNDGIEVSTGANPLQDDSQTYRAILNNGPAYDLYPSNVVLDVAVGEILLNASNNQARLSLQLEQSDDLQTWTNAGNSVEWVLSVDTNKQFFRVRSEP